MLTLDDIDMDALTSAMDGPEEGEIQWWIDPASGRIDLSTDDIGDDAPSGEELDEGGWIPIDPVGSAEGFRIMEDFIDSLPGGRQREALTRAIDQRKPFRHFKDTLYGFDDLPSRWHAFHDRRMRVEAIDWLVARGLIDAAESPPPGDDPAAPPPFEGSEPVPAAQRLSIHDIDPAAYQPMIALEKYIHAGRLGEDLLALVKIRASQINGCAFCLDMHGREARAAGIDERRLDVLSGWHEAPDLYSAREQAALALTGEITLIGEGGVSDETWAQATAAFGEQDLVVLIMAICTINVWNRMAIATRQPLPELPANAAPKGP